MTNSLLERDQDSPVAYSISRAAQILAIGVTTANTLVRSGALRSFRIGTRVLVSRGAIEDFVADRERSARGSGLEDGLTADHIH